MSIKIGSFSDSLGTISTLRQLGGIEHSTTISPESPFIIQPTIPSYSSANSYFIVGRHAGRRAVSIFDSPGLSGSGCYTSLLSGITTSNEWLPPNGNVPLMDETSGPYDGSSILRGVQTLSANRVFATGGVYGTTGDTRPLSTGGVDTFITFLNRIRTLLPTDPSTFSILSCNMTKRTTQTASLFFTTLMTNASKTFNITDYFQNGCAVGQISTTDYILSNNINFCGTTINQPPPTDGTNGTYAIINGLSTRFTSRYQPQIYTNGHLIQSNNPTPLHSKVYLIISRWFNYTNPNFNITTDLIYAIDWIIQEYVDGGQWVTSDPNTANYLPYDEFVVLSNFAFSNLYSFGTNTFNGSIVDTLKTTFTTWRTTNLSNDNQVYIGHDATVQALLSSLSLVSNSLVNHCSYIQGVLTLFVKSSGNIIKGYVLSPYKTGYDVSVLTTSAGNDILF
jgi:hypothetical protein